jgi:hypothetical protein
MTGSMQTQVPFTYWLKQFWIFMIDWHDLKLPPINLYSFPKDMGIKELELLEPQATGLKYDTEKLPLDLLDPLALEGLAAVLQFGAKKYASHNWRGGISWSRLIAALLRHSFAILRGEYVDPESGLPHIDHVGCCWMFASNLMKTRPDLDDLYKAPK